MSAVDRIVASAASRSLQPSLANEAQNCDDSLSFGDWRDAITSEHHALKASLEEIAQACDEAEMWGEGAKLRALANDL